MAEDGGRGTLCSNVYATIVVKMFQIYSVQNGKCICETFPAPGPCETGLKRIYWVNHSSNKNILCFYHCPI